MAIIALFAETGNLDFLAKIYEVFPFNRRRFTPIRASKVRAWNRENSLLFENLNLLEKRIKEISLNYSTTE